MEAVQSRRRHPNADDVNQSCAQFSNDFVGKQAGDHRSRGDDHGDNAGIGKRNIQLIVQHGSRGTKQRVRQAKADKCEINNSDQK